MSLSNDALKFVENYFFGDKKQFKKMPKVAQEIIELFLSDKNSSTLREEVTLFVANYKKLDKKQGADGYNDERKKYAEVKPEYAHKNEKGKQKKLAGGGSFNDITFKKINEIKDWDMLCSGFANDKCVFVARFPAEFITSMLETKLSKKINNPTTRKSVRFGYKQYIDCPNLEILYFDKDNSKGCMSKAMFQKFVNKIK